MPDLFLQHTGRIHATRNPEQGDNSTVTILTGEYGEFVLKAASTAAAEHRVLCALSAEQPFVPAPVAATADLLLMTCLPGVSLAEHRHGSNPAELHRLLVEAAHALRRIHSWRPDLPPPPGVLMGRLAGDGVTPDIVFAHNDYCLPNIMVYEGRISAVIDWPYGGYSDRRIDLAGAVESIRRNLQDEAYVETFLAAYGYGEFDLPYFIQIYDAF